MSEVESVWRLSFEGGTVCLRRGEPRGRSVPAGVVPPGCRWDPRQTLYRAPALQYANIVRFLRDRAEPYEDEAKAYVELRPSHVERHAPFPYQREALDAWLRCRRQGVVVLPTGSGKTFLATLAMDATRRSTLVVVPTIDLMHQWYDVLLGAFPEPVGLIGGGYHEPAEITVTTYDSAHLHLDRLGNRFGLVVFDECHHLPSEAYAAAARCAIAPFRLGLTATPERLDGGELLYAELIGDVVYRRDIDELSGDYLADYETHRITVELSPDERVAYERERGLYLAFLRETGIAISSSRGWNDFIIRSSRTPAGRRAFLAYRRQRALALAAGAKLEVLARLLHAHRGDRTLVFTEDNATVYRIAERFLVPAITHQTKVKERTEILQKFNRGVLGVVVTSKVLNEGVNVPEANVAVVLSGSGSVREHVQRLGRILRKREGKRAVLYEVVAADTAEVRVSAKRRDHRAYR